MHLKEIMTSYTIVDAVERKERVLNTAQEDIMLRFCILNTLPTLQSLEVSLQQNKKKRVPCVFNKSTVLILCRNAFCVCLIKVYRPTREFFTHLKTSLLPVKGCRFWPMTLSSEGSLTCHAYCDTGHLFVMVISYDLWLVTLAPILPSVKQVSCHYLFHDLSLSRCILGHNILQNINI